MLVLSRRPGEKIIITTPEGRRIEVIYVRSSQRDSGKIRLGFISDRDVTVDREEVAAKRAAVPGKVPMADMHTE